MILQAYEYEEQGLKKNRGKFLEDFFRSTKGVFKTDLVKALVQHLYELREKLHQKQ